MYGFASHEIWGAILKNNNSFIFVVILFSRGRDIKVVSNISSLEFHHASVVQRYIDNPALLAGYPKREREEEKK